METMTRPYKLPITGQGWRRLYLDGIDDYIKVENPNISIKNKITIETALIFKKIKKEVIICKKDEFSIYIEDSGKLKFSFGKGSITSNTILMTNQFYHLGCVYDGSSFYIYIYNGRNEIEKSQKLGKYSTITNSSPIYIGMDYDNKNYCNIELFWLSIMAEPLNQSNIEALRIGRLEQNDSIFNCQMWYDFRLASEIKNRQNNPAPGILYSEIFIPNDTYLGTGKYIVVLEPNAMTSKNPISSIVIKAPLFQISMNFNNLTKEIPILLGRSDNTPPISQHIFNLPENISLSDSYTFETNFENWKIKDLLLNDISLQRKILPGTISFWFDPKRNPGAFTEGIRYSWGTFKINGEECAIISDGKILSGILNQGSENERMIFHEILNPDTSVRHMITITWNDEECNLYFDGKHIQNVNFNNLDK